MNWQKSVFTICLFAGIIIGTATGKRYQAIAIAAAAGLVLQLAVNKFWPPKER